MDDTHHSKVLNNSIIQKKMAKHSNVGRKVQGVAAEIKHLLHIAWQQYQTACAKQQAHKH